MKFCVLSLHPPYGNDIGAQLKRVGCTEHDVHIITAEAPLTRELLFKYDAILFDILYHSLSDVNEIGNLLADYADAGLKKKF